MVFMLDGNSKKSARLWSDLGYLLCSRHLFRSVKVTNLNFISGKFRFYSACYNLPFQTGRNVIVVYRWCIAWEKENIMVLILDGNSEMVRTY